MVTNIKLSSVILARQFVHNVQVEHKKFCWTTQMNYIYMYYISIASAYDWILKKRIMKNK